MTTEPTIGVRPDDGDETSPRQADLRPARQWRAVAGIAGMLCLIGLLTLVDGDGEAPSTTGVLSAPSTTASPHRVSEPVPSVVDADLGRGHLDWATVPLGGRTLTAAGEVAGRLVLAVADATGVNRLAFVSGSTLVPGVEIGSPVDLLTDWRNRMVLVGSHDGEPVLHIQRADATLRRLPPPRFDDAAVARIADITATPDRLVAMAVSPDGRLARGVWSSADGVEWDHLPELAEARSIATLSDGRVLAWLDSGAFVSDDGLVWRPFTAPQWVSEARGNANLWSATALGTGVVAVSGDGREWQPVSLAPVLSGSSAASVASGGAGYAVAVPPTSGVDPSPAWGLVATSPDGLVWSVVPVPTRARHPVTRVAANSFVVEGDDAILVGFTRR